MVFMIVLFRKIYNLRCLYLCVVVFLLFSCILWKKTFEFNNLKIMRIKESSTSTNKCSVTEVKFSERKLPLTALISFPGSGNTWTRYMLEQLTGIATGSVYCDGRLKDVFIGECSKGRDVIVIKTHKVVKNEKVPFEKAVILIRNPHSAILSLFNLVYTGSQMATAPLNTYEKHFNTYANAKVGYWKDIYDSWNNRGIPKYVLVYEKLKANPFEEMKKLLVFLGIHVPDTHIRCALQGAEGQYHRQHHGISFDPWSYYTKRTNESIKTVVEDIQKQYPDINYL